MSKNKKFKNSKKTSQPASDVRSEFLRAVLNELKLGPQDFFIIGSGAHLFSDNPLAKDTAVRESLCCYMVVDAATFAYILANKPLSERSMNGYRMISLPGPGLRGQGGVVFVLADKGLSISYNSTRVIEDFLFNIISFRSYLEGAVSLNILALIASSSMLSKRFKNEYDYDKIKHMLMRESNLGTTLFFEPTNLYHGICLVNTTREIPGWGVDRSDDNCEMCNYLIEMSDRAKDLEETDADVIEYHKHLTNPNFLHPDQPENQPVEEQPPLFQEMVIPNPDIVTPFDPKL